MLHAIIFSICIIGIIAHAWYVYKTDKFTSIDYCIFATLSIVPFMCILDWIFG